MFIFLSDFEMEIIVERLLGKKSANKRMNINVLPLAIGLYLVGELLHT